MGEVVQLRPELRPLAVISHLPPLDAWKVNPNKLKKFRAPTDDRGFVLPIATIERILKLFEDDYRWPVSWAKDAPQILRPDDHHFHWTKSDYDPSKFTHLAKATVPLKFRELPTMRGIIPRQFHNVLHEVTLPPIMPKVEYMDHYLRSYEIAQSLFRSAERALDLRERFDAATRDTDAERFIRQYCDIFSAYKGHMKKARGAQAMRSMGLDDLEFEPSENTLDLVVARLGSCALVNIPNYTKDHFLSRIQMAA